MNSEAQTLERNTIMASIQKIFASIAVLIGCLLGLVSQPAVALVLVPPEPADRVLVAVTAAVTFDNSNHLYTYDYTVRSDVSSQQEVWSLVVKVNDEVVAGTAPPGWDFTYDADKRIVSWAATEGIEGEDLTGADDGGVTPSPFQIKPGETLHGFSFKSVSPSETVTFYAEGYTPIPVAESEDDFEAEGYELKPYTEDSFRGETLGPMAAEAYSGNRRPGVDGFLGFTNLQNNDTFAAPVTIGIQFSLAGEIVDRSSFSATLNGVDVTSAFLPSDQVPGDLAATFELGNSPLQVGKNVLITSVAGQVPGTTRSAADIDRITFLVQ